MFHGLVVLAAIWLGLFSVSPAPPMLTIMEMSLDALPGAGGAGGDGQVAGGSQAWESDSKAGAATGLDASLASPPLDNQATNPSRTDEQAAKTSADSTAPPPPNLATEALPPKTVPAPPVLKPATRPAKRPSTEPHVARTAKREKSPARDVAETATAPPAASPVPGSGQESGLAGDGPGKGPGRGPGPGGNGGEGPGGGGGEDYVGQFGQGDGPKFRHRVVPRYPDAAKRANKEGQVVLQLAIDAQGTLLKVNVLVQNGLEFVEEAVRALRASSFLPAARHGRAVPCLATLAIHFKLGN